MLSPRALVAVAAAAVVLAPPAHAATFPAAATFLVSRPTGDVLPSGATNGSYIDGPGAVSADGRYVVFESGSDGLLAAGRHSGYDQAFRWDRTTGAVQLISHTVGAGSTAPGTESSGGATISADGRYVAYYSQASDTAAGDTNDWADCLVWDATTDTSVIASRPTGTVTQSNGFNTGCEISGDGNHVTWESEATNIDAADTNPERTVYERVLNTNTTVLVSRADGAGGGVPTAAYSGMPSADGDWVAFTTPGNSLDPTVTDVNNASDIYVRQLSTNHTYLVSRKEGGGDPVAGGAPGTASITANGSAIVFSTSTDGLVAGDANGVGDVYERTGLASGAAGTTTLVSSREGTSQAGNGASSVPVISADGSTVAFATAATDLVAADTSGTPDFVARDTGGTGAYHLLSRSPGGTAASSTAYGAGYAALDATGANAVVSGIFPDMSTLDDPAFPSVFAIAVASGPATLVSIPQGQTTPFVGGLDATSFGGGDAISANGRYAAFVSRSSAFALDQPVSMPEGYVRDSAAGTLTLATRATGAAGAPANDAVHGVMLSADGRYLAFDSMATNLDPAATAGKWEVYLRDIRTGTTTLLSRAASGDAANDDSFVSGISADGSHVVFVSYATNLPDDADANGDVFVRDVPGGQTILASRADGAAGVKAANGSGNAVISGNGRFVAFTTNAPNLIGPLPAAEVFVRDLQAQTTVAVSRADGAAGALANQAASSPRLSADGSIAAFISKATNLGTPPINGQLWLRNIPAGTTVVASRATGAFGTPTNSPPLSAAISGDGSRVAWSQFAGDLTGEASASQPQGFTRDLNLGTTTLVTRADGATGAPQTQSNLMTTPTLALSADGHCLAWNTPAAGLAPVDYATHDTLAVYERVIDGTCGGDADVLPPASVPTPIPPVPKPRPDTTRPVLDHFTATPHTFTVGRDKTALSAVVRGGTTLRYRLSEAATVRIAVARELPGRRTGKRCVRPTRRNAKARHCTRLKTIVTLTRAAPAGTSKVRFSGRVGRTVLAAGRYTLTAVATDKAGNTSHRKQTRITIRR